MNFTFKVVTLGCILLLSIITSLNAQDDQKAKQLDAMIQKGMEDWNIPGLATVVVKDGEVVFKKVYGVQNLQTEIPVNFKTNFAMASTTKAIVAMALGMLVDQGKLNWKDKVRDHLPGFRLSDAYITEEARVQDLLTHNLGIEGADYIWILDSLSTKASLEQFRFVDKGYPLRGGFRYNNMTYAVAGELLEEVSGKHWSNFVEDHILKPLQMSRTLTRSIDVFKSGNYVTPYNEELDGAIVDMNYDLSDQIGAAGMMWSNVDDISNYLKFLVNDGIYQKDTLIQPDTYNYLFKPHALIPDSEFYPTHKLTNPHWKTYGLGWFQQDYRGEKMDFHTGSLTGLVAITGLMRNKDVAVYLFANLDHAELRHAILLKVMDLYAFNDNSRDWHKEILELYRKSDQEYREYKKEQDSLRVRGTTTTLNLKAYEGKYKAKKGVVKLDVVVEAFQDGLKLIVNDYLTYYASHWHYDTFKTDKNNEHKAEFHFNFNLGLNGKVEELDLFGETLKKTEEDKE